MYLDFGIIFIYLCYISLFSPNSFYFCLSHTGKIAADKNAKKISRPNERQTKGKRKANERQRSAPECKQAKSPPTRKPKNVGRPNERQTKGKYQLGYASGQNRCRQEKQENGRPNERYYILLISIEILSPSIEPQTAI